MIHLENVSKKYKKALRPALDDVSLDVDEGEFVSLVGRSGAGKSTLVRMLIADEQPDTGRIVVDKWHVHALKPKQLPQYRRQLGVVFQDFKLINRKNAFENVEFAMQVSGLSRKVIKQTVPQVLELVGLKDVMHHFPAELSGGEKQRIALARALIHQPKVLIADEPTGNLDAMNSWEIAELLLRLNQELNMTILMVTHNKEIVNAMKKRVITLDAGRVVQDQKIGKYLI